MTAVAFVGPAEEEGGDDRPDHPDGRIAAGDLGGKAQLVQRIGHVKGCRQGAQVEDLPGQDVAPERFVLFEHADELLDVGRPFGYGLRGVPLRFPAKRDRGE